MTDIVLVYPSMDDGVNPHGSMVPLSFAWMASLLEARGFSVRIIDLQVEDVDLEDVLRKERPLCVGASGTTQSRFQSFRILERAKAIDPGIVTLYGGPHATPTAEDSLRRVPAIDIVVRNEGEMTVLELLGALRADRRLEPRKIRGISYREDGAVVHNAPRPFIEDLDELPFPAWHLYRTDRYHLEMDGLGIHGQVIVTTRGCPFDCSFCSARLLWSRHYSRRSPRGVGDELEYLVGRQSIGGFKVFDSTFTVNRAHVTGICDEIRRRGLEGLKWECEVRADTVDRDLLRTMKEAGCYYIDMGLESACPRVLKRISKGIDPRQVEDVLRWANELGILVKLFVTWGHPTETYREAMETYRFVRRVRHLVHKVAAHVGIVIYPGTEVERFARERGYLPPDFSWGRPYRDPRAAKLRSDPGIPLLCQPQMGYRHLARIAFRLNWLPLLTPSNVLEKLWRMLRDRESRRKYTNAAIDLLNERFDWEIAHR